MRLPFAGLLLGAAIPALAQGMRGGITDVNVQQIMALRKGPPVMGRG